jgi:hypothetical protein
MRYSASDKIEIIRLVEQSPWPARWTLERAVVQMLKIGTRKCSGG